MGFWRFINSNFGLLIAGFVLTTILGGLLSWWFQHLSWERETRLELYSKRYDEGVNFLEDISKLTEKRLYWLQQWLWAIEGRGKLDEIEIEYFKVADEWNVRLRTTRSKIRLLIGEQYANDFLYYEDEAKMVKTKGIHSFFVKAHLLVLDVKAKRAKATEAQQEIDRLNRACTTFLEKLTNVFLKKASSLKLLEVKETQ
jgi:hypothetical protein